MADKSPLGFTLSEAVEREVRQVIGDLQMQVIVLRKMIDMAQAAGPSPAESPPGKPAQPHQTPQQPSPHPNPVHQPDDPKPQPKEPPQQDPRPSARQRLSVNMNGGADGRHR